MGVRFSGKAGECEPARRASAPSDVMLELFDGQPVAVELGLSRYPNAWLQFGYGLEDRSLSQGPRTNSGGRPPFPQSLALEWAYCSEVRGGQ